MNNYIDGDGNVKVLMRNFELDPEYYVKRLDELASKLDMKDECTRIVVVTSEAAKIHFELIEAIRKEYDVQIVDEMPRVAVNVGTIGHCDYGVDVITNRNNHFLHGRGSKGDRIRRRQQFNNQCGYKGRRK